jgi:hypothetical protein
MNVWQCYCFQEALKRFDTFVNDDFGNGDKPCGTWLAQYTMTLGIIYGLAFLITILNVILQKGLYYLAFFERPHNMTEQLHSATNKSWTIFFVQTAVVLVVINSYYKRIPLPDNSPVFRGKYPDFTAEWYVSIGATIALAVLINAFMPVSNLIELFTTFLSRCCDRRCKWHKSETSKILQVDYENLYIGSEFEIAARYATLIGFTWIFMMFSTAMPVMYPFAAILCFVSYWVDKYMFIRHHKLPPAHGL